MKKKIDTIFQERFHNLETAPPKESWENIISALPAKNERKIIPIWYKLAGTAAVLALMLSFYNIFLPQGSIEGAPFVNIEAEKKYLYTDPVSENFKETMKLSSTLLDYLKLESLKKQIENKALSTTETQSYNRDLAATIEIEKEHINPRTYGTEPELVDSLLTEDKKIEQKHFEKSNLAENKEDHKTSNKIDFLVHIDSKKENLADKSMEEKSNLKRLSIRPTAGAIYFDNFGDGNSLDPQFSNNKSNGEFTMAYGVNLAYKINSKLNVRTGVNKINLSHNTQNIEFGVATLSANLNPQELDTPVLTSSDVNGYLNQSLEYIEIPLELELSLVDNKIGLNIIGGASTFFLDGNMISHNSPIAKTELGEANNLNNLSFSANIGLGINYKFSPQFQFDLEPIFKYQINTFNKGSGLTPYIFGIYSGLTFNF